MSGAATSGTGAGSVIVGLRRLARVSWMLILFLVAWETWFRVSGSLFVPPMSEILSRMVTKWFELDPSTLFTSQFFRVHALASLARFGVGWAVAVGLGVAVGLLLGAFSWAEATAHWIVRFGVSTPSTILLPVAVVLFGVTNQMNVFLIATGAIWPVLLNTMDAVRGIDPETVAAARSLRLKGWRLFTKVILRAASPQIMAGVRVSLGIALILVIISEMFVATKGIGFDVIFSQRTFAFLEMWASVAFVGLVAITLNGLFHLAERRLLGWHEGMGGSTHG